LTQVPRQCRSDRAAAAHCVGGGSCLASRSIGLLPAYVLTVLLSFWERVVIAVILDWRRSCAGHSPPCALPFGRDPCRTVEGVHGAGDRRHFGRLAARNPMYVGLTLLSRRAIYFFWRSDWMLVMTIVLCAGDPLRRGQARGALPRSEIRRMPTAPTRRACRATAFRVELSENIKPFMSKPFRQSSILRRPRLASIGRSNVRREESACARRVGIIGAGPAGLNAGAAGCHLAGHRVGHHQKPQPKLHREPGSRRADRAWAADLLTEWVVGERMQREGILHWASNSA